MEEVKITKLTSTSAWDSTDHCFHEFVYGLGEDNKVYYWDFVNGGWSLWCQNKE